MNSVIGPVSAQAQITPETVAEVIYVYGIRDTYRQDESSSVTRTPTPIEEIPQSIFVITRDVIDDQAMTGLAELVRYVPGVSMGQGEGHRDAPVFRGNISTSDFFVDGIRDDLQYFRDVYNVDRVDVIKGPSALVFGRGNGGGSLNRVSKTADESIRSVDLSLGTEEQARLAADLGGDFNDRYAGRLNAVIEESNSHRDDVEISRMGVAPTIRIQVSEDTLINVFAEYFSDERTVDRGVPSEAGRPWNGSVDTYFGNPDLSDSDIEVMALRSVLDHDFGNGLSFRGALSYGDYSKFYQNIFAGGAVNTQTGTVPISSYNSSTERDNLLAQADLVWEAELAGMEHTLLTGLEAGQQQSLNQRINAAGGNFPLNDRGRNFSPDFNLAPAQHNENNLVLFAALIQDQVAVTDQFSIVAGLRWDSFDLEFDDLRPSSNDFSRKDDFISPRAGIVWELMDKLSLYGGWSESRLPQSGEQFSSLNATTAALEPEKFENMETGIRWTPMDGLLLSATVFKLDRTNTTAPGATPGTTVLTGSQRSKGLELGIQGELREDWHLIGALALQEAEITSTTNAAPAGRKAPLVPEFSASLWNRVSITDELDVALGVIHQGEQFASITNSVTLPSYTRVDAGMFYELTEQIDLQLNIENLTDKKYWSTAHNDNNITPGAPVMARFSVAAEF